MILVTGATGFLGAELARQLADNGKKLICIKRSSSKIPAVLAQYQGFITWKDADLLNYYALEDALEGVTQVYHCAALVSFNPADTKQMIKTNVEGTANIVNLCMQFYARLVHVSSIAAIGEAKPGLLINENNHLEESPFENGYAISKYESEMEVWRGIAEGLNAVIINPSLIIGTSAGAEGSGKIFDKIRQGLSFYTQGSCGLVDVEDVAKCMTGLMNSNIANERFIINAENYTYQQLFTEAAKNFDMPAPKKQVKPWILETAWRVSALMSFVSRKPVGVDKISAQSASKKLNYDNEKIKKALGFQFKPLRDTIAAICRSLAASPIG